jgi:hypothetical protein
VPDLTARVADAPAHLDRCWLEPERKQSLRQVGERIGLASEETVIS